LLSRWRLKKPNKTTKWALLKWEQTSQHSSVEVEQAFMEVQELELDKLQVVDSPMEQLQKEDPYLGRQVLPEVEVLSKVGLVRWADQEVSTLELPVHQELQTAVEVLHSDKPLNSEVQVVFSVQANRLLLEQLEEMIHMTFQLI
jgi:hypothetical protein